MKVSVVTSVIVTVILSVILTIPSPAEAVSVSPTVIATTSGHDPAATMSHIVNLFTGAAVGDLLLVCHNFNIATTVTLPAGWVLIVEGVNVGNNQMDCYYHFYAIGDAFITVTVTTSGSVDSTYVGYQIIGADTSQRIRGVPVLGNSANPDPPSVTVTPAIAGLAIAAFIWGNSAFVSLTSYPTGFGSNPVKDDAHAVSSASAAMGTRSEVFGPEDPPAATLSGVVKWIATTIAVVALPSTVATSDIWLLLLLVFFFLLVFALAEDADNPIYIVTFSIFTGLLGVLLAIQVDVVVANSILSVFIGVLAVFMLIRGVFRVVGD